MSELGSLHDHFFKETFARPEVAADFLRNYLPAPVAHLLELGTLTPLPGSYVDPELREQFSDLLYRVRLRDGQAALVYVLFEAKSRPDPLVAFQLLRYMVRIWERALRSGEGLVPIIPVVVYHGRERWRIGQDFQDLYDGPEAQRGYWPSFSYQLSDVSVSGGTELVGALWLQAVLAALRHITSPNLATRLAEMMTWMSSAEGVPGLAEMWQALVNYVFFGNEAVSEADVKAALEIGFAGRGEAMMSTVVEKYIQQGRQEGRQEGERRGVLASIEVVLQLRFGADGLSLMPAIAAIEAVSQLLKVQAALITAMNIDDVRRVIA